MPRQQTANKKKSLYRVQFGIGSGLILLVWLVFGQTLGHDFVNYDDKTYVYGNSIVSAGLSVRGLGRAFVDMQTGNWHPLTLISHMLDCQLYGLKAGGHHFTNVLLHTGAVLLLFIWLQRVTSYPSAPRDESGRSAAGRIRAIGEGADRTGPVWASAFVAGVFAIHPLRVESVAWLAERKDVLSAVFFFLTLAAYARYVREKSFGRYLTMSTLFACGLMSKPMLVTTPVVLLLLDYWPFNRGPAFAQATPKFFASGAARPAQVRDQKSGNMTVWWKLVAEKLPLFGLSVIASIVTFMLQERSTGAIAQLPFGWRFENGLVTYVTYIWQLFWPVNLAVFYPHPENHLPLWQVLGASALLVAVTTLTWAWRYRRPYLLVGWLWYLVMLLPVIGFVEAGLQGRADRYTYLPHVGLYLAIVWLVADLSKSLPRREIILATVGSIIIVALSAAAWKQTIYWRSSETLWTHTLAVTKNNDVAHTNLAMLLTEHGRLDDALSHFQTALEVRSASAHSRHYDLSLALIHSDIGNALARIGRLDEAIVHLRQAIQFQPSYPDAHYNLGTALFQKGELDNAIAEWRTTLALSPEDAQSLTNLGNVFVQKGSLREAMEYYEKALQSPVNSERALNNLAWILSTAPDDALRNGARAVELAREANRLTQGDNPFFMRTLAAAYAEVGQFDRAIEAGQNASELANSQGQRGLAVQIQDETDRYRRHLPVRDPSLTNAQKNP